MSQVLCRWYLRIIAFHMSILRVGEETSQRRKRDQYVGGPTGPYACMGIQIPQALLTLLDDSSLLCPFSQEEGYTYTNNIYVYDRSPAGKELDFDSNPDKKEPFVRYAVSF